MAIAYNIMEVTISFLIQIEEAGGQTLTFEGDVSKEPDVASMIKTVTHNSLFTTY